MSESSKPSAPRIWVTLLLGLAALLIGTGVAWTVIPQPAVGVVRLDSMIWSFTVTDVAAQLAYARENPAIRTVVFLVDSPGGDVASSETLYLEVLRTRKVKPVVASVEGLAASGAYYAVIPSDYIYAKPSSIVGNIGVVSSLPLDTFVDEELIATGPFKLFGDSRESHARYMESIKESFLNSVMAQRGDRLKVDRATLSRGEIYLGMNAVEMGLVDDIGTPEDAARRAAEMAKIINYRVVDISKELGKGNVSVASPWDEKQLSKLPPGFYYLYTGPR
jgi:protease-4